MSSWSSSVDGPLFEGSGRGEHFRPRKSHRSVTQFHERNLPLPGCDRPRPLGHGDVEVSLSMVEELPYVLGLARQSLEKQLGVTPEV